MNSESKTTEDILREMREYADRLDNDGDITGADFRDFANQLEEAIKREKAVTDAMLACKGKMFPHPDPKHAPPPYPGNAAMREALIQCELFLGNVSRHAHPTLNPGDKCVACDGVDELRGMVVAALDTPARNCDVGTPIEQAERFKAFCLPRVIKCSENSKCPAKHPCNQIGIQYCQLKWAQMPYEKEGAPK